MSDDYLFCPECGVKIEALQFVKPDGNTKYCKKCGAIMAEDMFYCLECGEAFDDLPYERGGKPIIYRQPGLWRNKWVSLILCIFFGWFGAHKYYESKVVMGVLYTLSFGLFGFGWIADIIILACKPNPYLAKADRRGGSRLGILCSLRNKTERWGKILPEMWTARRKYQETKHTTPN